MPQWLLDYLVTSSHYNSQMLTSLEDSFEAIGIRAHITAVKIPFIEWIEQLLHVVALCPLSVVHWVAASGAPSLVSPA
jgi:hypothetical protein